MAVPSMMDSAVGATVDTGVPGDVEEAGCCMSILDNFAAQDASGVVDHGRHGGHGDWWRVVGPRGRVLWEPHALL